MKNEHFLQIQSRIIESAQVPQSVASAMEDWSNWMRHGTGVKGYPGASVGFTTGGVNCFDDLDDAAANYAARAVDGAIDSLDHVSRTCIGIIWLGHTIRLNRINVEDKAIEAVRIIWRGLQIRGVA